MLIAVVKDALKHDVVLSSMLSVEDDEVLGPSQQFDAPLIAEDESGNTFDVGASCSFLVLTFWTQSSTSSGSTAQ